MADQKAGSPNAAQIEFWNSTAARAWADQYERMDRAVADLMKALLDMAAPQLGEHVLDIGCGSGTTVLELAARVGPGGRVLGADISEQSAARARQRIADAGPRHAEVIVADVSVHPFAQDNFEPAFSRFGVMFFSDPQAAFANVRRAMKPGGRLALAVFRAAGENLWPNGPLEAVRHLLPPLPPPGLEEPGPFPWADPTRVLTPVDPLIRLASTGEAAEAVDFVMALGPLTRVALSAPQREAVRAALETSFKSIPDHTGSSCRPQTGWCGRAFDAVLGGTGHSPCSTISALVSAALSQGDPHSLEHSISSSRSLLRLHDRAS